MIGKHVEIFLVDGKPGGITTAEIAGWTGHVLFGPRSDMARMLGREEVSRNGVYLLLGSDAGALEGVVCYVGRTEDFRNRLSSHHLNKDFWDHVVVISAKDDAFNEGHWAYLEARLIVIAKQAARSSLVNANVPQVRKLSEAQRSDMEAFISELKIVLPVLGINVLRGADENSELRKPEKESPTFTLRKRRSGYKYDVRGRFVDGEFVVLEGSVVVAEWRGQAHAASTARAYAAFKALHQRLIDEGSIAVVDGKGIVTRDIPFSSPSYAASVVKGTSCNGRTNWEWEGGTLGEWEDRDLPG
ncbi:GIY-YIG nuclease family protein [Buchananella hordeovulneris]|uniref:GIY-YIG nuclease family protein n=1 Tax=Buchananella hordeovulneris TaxID=52770 RepID=UPI000F5EF6A8|nr:GIY-YIG nuclease family protein [Buchananella hordeovulneris]RRD44947.1 GIY-YIG nuclease family protein [Buchananella hordeovulneris]